MRTGPECIACFMRQALATARLSTDDLDVHQLVINATGRLLAQLDWSLSPPENAVAVYQLIADVTGNDDPYKQLKRTSNAFARELRSQVRERIENAADPLYAAVRYAIAGNVIDYGTPHKFDAAHVLEKCLETPLVVDDFALLRREVAGSSAKDILYLGDNCGEIVFDALLVEQLLKYGHNVTLVVRGKEILNDATMSDVVDLGIDKLCPVMSSETSCPGTSLGSCSTELREAFSRADLVISKGQGNFETLSEVARPVYFLLTVKCAVVARHLEALKNAPPGRITGCGEMVLLKMEAHNAYATD